MVPVPREKNCRQAGLAADTALIQSAEWEG
jgi:hypothetical protein